MKKRASRRNRQGFVYMEPFILFYVLGLIGAIFTLLFPCLDYRRYPYTYHGYEPLDFEPQSPSKKPRLQPFRNILNPGEQTGKDIAPEPVTANLVTMS